MADILNFEKLTIKIHRYKYWIAIRISDIREDQTLVSGCVEKVLKKVERAQAN